MIWNTLLLALVPTVAAPQDGSEPDGLLAPLETAEAVEAQDTASASAPSSASAEVSTFELGVDAYRRGEYGEAEAYWRECLALPLGDDDLARVAYNLGNVAWRRSEPLVAVGWYSLAVEHAPRDADAWHNLERARAAAELPPADRGDLRDTLDRITGALRPKEARALAGFAFVLLALVLTIEALRGGVWWRRGALVTLVLAVVACIPWMRSLGEEPATVLVVRAPSVPLRSEPRRELDPIADVRAGESVERIDALPGWVRVETSEGERGWVQEGAVFDASAAVR